MSFAHRDTQRDQERSRWQDRYEAFKESHAEKSEDADCDDPWNQSSERVHAIALYRSSCFLPTADVFGFMCICRFHRFPFETIHHRELHRENSAHSFNCNTTGSTKTKICRRPCTAAFYGSPARDPGDGRLVRPSMVLTPLGSPHRSIAQ